MSDRYPQDSASGLFNARRLRWAIGLTILLVLVLVLLDSLEQTIARAEQQSAKLMLNQLRSALLVKGAEARLDGRRELADLAGVNPFEWFENSPPNYSGLCDENGARIGNWCFKPAQTGNKGYKKYQQGDAGRVIFRPNQPITLEERQGSHEAPLSWVVGIEFQDRNGNGRLDSDEPQTGLKLEPVGAGNTP